MDLADSLVGRAVDGVDVSLDNYRLRFRFGDAKVVWATEGDCCSVSWWNDAVGLSALRGGRTVSSVLTVELPNVPDGPDELTQAYGIRVATDRGAATFIFRNASNGYYGGWAFVENYTGDEEWRELEGSEWSA